VNKGGNHLQPNLSQISGLTTST
jgi:dynein heavy chain, axonemal